MNYLSVCSGIEAASVAWHGLGWKPIGFSEIEPFPSAVLQNRFPGVKNFGDMTKFKEWENVGTVDLLVGGTPCQSFSVAGLRKGLADPRGNLMLTFGAIAHHFKVRWIVWENVPGVLSSNKGRDFGAFLGMLAECGYGFAYRVLDAHFFGVPQRRRRVFVVGCLGNWLSAAKVLFDSESLSGNPPPRRKTGKEAAGNTQNSTGKTDRIISIGIDEECNATINGMGALLRGGQGGTRQAVCLMDQGGSVMSVEEEKTGTLRAQTHGNEPVVCFVQNVRNEVRLMGGDGKIAGALMADAGVKQTNYLCYENHAQDSRITECGEICPTISSKTGTGGGNLPLVQEFPNRPKFWNGNDFAECLTATGADDRMPDKGRLPCVIEPTLTARTGTGVGNLPIVMAHGQANAEITEGLSPTLTCRSEQPIVSRYSQIRRFTPKECERLQGFPDDWTRIPWRNKPAEQCPDGPRYKACGNSMAVPVMRWIGERIEKVDSFRRD